jgi:hypothetical protein
MTGKGNISINVSGGGVSIGNIAQGDNNTTYIGHVTAEAAATPLFDETVKALESAPAAARVDVQEVAKLRDELRALKAMVCSEDAGQREKASGFLSQLQEKYSWAASALSSLANGLTVMSLL